VEDGRALIKLEECSARVFAWRGPTLEAKVIVRVQVNGAPTQPGDRLAVIGDCPELGRWDLREAHDLECVNGNTWFGEIPFEESTGRPVGYKFVIFPAGENSAPRRENRLVRRRLLVPEGCAKWRDEWEGC
jgi:cyclomaltodextrin glucanotransferase